MLTSNQRNWLVFFGAIALVAGFSFAYIGTVGLNEDSIRALLRWSARIAFCLFLVVFVARPLQQIFRTPFTAKLLRNRRLLGIAFAGVHTAHLGLIFYRASMFSDFQIHVADHVLRILVYLAMLLMFATSFDATARMIGRRNWKILHKIGLFGLFIGFAAAARPRSLDFVAETDAYVLSALVLTALVIRVTARLR